MSEHLIDNRNLACPQPVINTKKALESLKSGTIVSLVDNFIAKENVSRLAASLGCDCSIEEKDGLYYLRITKVDREQVEISAPTPDISLPSLYSSRLILITSAELGTGERELGGILMKSLLYTASQAIGQLPKYVILINSGVTLALPESASFAHLTHLAELGVEVICCGACIDYYGLADRFKVGHISNMYEIYDLLSQHEVLRI